MAGSPLKPQSTRHRGPRAEEHPLSGRLGSCSLLPQAQSAQLSGDLAVVGGHGEGGSGCAGARGPLRAAPFRGSPGASSGPCADRKLCFGPRHRPVLAYVARGPLVYFSLFYLVKNFRFVDQPSAGLGCSVLTLFLQKCFFLTQLWNRSR